MPDISALFLALYKDRGAMYIANELGHSTTKRVERWNKEGEVPEASKFSVYELLSKEGVL